jgi:hypothetical protein
MGTRCLTVIVEETGAEIAVLYRQFDGYPSGHGEELAKFLGGFKIVNGFSSGAEVGKVANGMGCLAAQLVAHFKKSVGGIYLHSAGTRDAGEEFIYFVRVGPDIGREARVQMKVTTSDEGEVLSDWGLASDFDAKAAEANH